MDSRSFIIERSGHDSGLEVFHSTTRIDPQEILDLVLFYDLSRRPGHSKGPIRRRSEHNVAILLSRGDDAQVTFGRWWFNDGGQFADSLRVNNQFLGSSFVGHPCATKFHGVVVSIMNDVEFSPEETVDSGSIFHTSHIEFVGGYGGVQGNVLTRVQFEAEGCRHIEDGRGATRRRSSVLVPSGV